MGYTTVKTIRLANATTTLDQVQPIGTGIFNEDTDISYRLIGNALATDTITTLLAAGDLQEVERNNEYRGTALAADAVPSNLQNGDWVRCASAGTNNYTNFDNLSADLGDRLEYDLATTAWNRVVDSGSGNIILTSNMDANSFKVEDSADATADQDLSNYKQLLLASYQLWFDVYDDTISISALSVGVKRSEILKIFKKIQVYGLDSSKYHKFEFIRRDQSNLWGIIIMEWNSGTAQWDQVYYGQTGSELTDWDITQASVRLVATLDWSYIPTNWGEYLWGAAQAEPALVLNENCYGDGFYNGFDQDLNTTDSVEFVAVTAATVDITGSLPTGTIASPPAVSIGDFWLDTTDSAVNPILRQKIS